MIRHCGDGSGSIQSTNGGPTIQLDDTNGVMTDTDPTVKCSVQLVHRYEGGQLSLRVKDSAGNSQSATCLIRVLH